MKAPAKIGKTVMRAMLTRIAMVTGNEKRIDRVILDGNVMNWVGIGWVNESKPTPAQRKVLPVVID